MDINIETNDNRLQVYSYKIFLSKLYFTAKIKLIKTLLTFNDYMMIFSLQDLFTVKILTKYYATLKSYKISQNITQPFLITLYNIL